MIKLSKEVQGTLEGIDIDRSPVTTQEEEDIFALAMGKIQANAAENVTKGKGKRMKPVYLVAAVLATIGLLGAGYASVYFGKLFVPGDDPVDYDIQIHNPELLVEPPAFDGELTGSRQVLEVDSLGTRNLELLFSGKEPGDILDLELHAPDRKELVQLVTGSGLNLLFSLDETGAPGCDLLINRASAPDTEQVVKGMIARGEFIATLDSEEFKAYSYQYGRFPSLTYRDSNGATVSVTFERLFGKSEMPQETYENAQSEDWIIDGHPFVYSDLGFTSILNLYLGEADEVDKTRVSIHYQKGSKEQYALVANQLVLHNLENNGIHLPGKELFESFPHPDIQGDAAKIAAAVGNYRGESMVSGTVWEKNGAKVRSAESGRRFFIDLKEPLAKDTAFYPYEAHTPLVDQPWFPWAQLTGLTITYEDGKLASLTYTDEDWDYGFDSEIAANGYMMSPLDAILVKMDSEHQWMEVVKLVDADSPSPTLIARQADSDLVYIYSAVEVGSGDFLVQRLYMPSEALPSDLLGN